MARYLIAFERIGTSRGIEPLTITAAGNEDLAREIHAYAQHHGLTTVWVDLKHDLSGGHLHRLQGDNLGNCVIVPIAENKVEGPLRDDV
ncbi:hypothetical protein GCM10009733_020560 [Nonomuraea maheshkhaliensis]|uniref:Uncharacterized protein n=1 Tax=Nonomuraea maheshkhaliensis TaxID=419590 RepID=A0ABP4QY11_9ACTN